MPTVDLINIWGITIIFNNTTDTDFIILNRSLGKLYCNKVGTAERFNGINVYLLQA